MSNISVEPKNITFNQLIPSGVYKVYVNVSSKGKLLGSGYRTGEVTTPLKFWSKK
jgi:hypothetical protein